MTKKSIGKSVFVPVLWLMFAATPVLALSDQPYLPPDTIDAVHLIPPPPAPNSIEQRRDVDAVLELQKHRSEEETRRAEDDATVSIYRFADVLGPNFTAEKVRGVAAFLAKAIRETSATNNMLKNCYERPRPFVASSDVHPPGTMQMSVANLAGTVNTAPQIPNLTCRAAEATPVFSYSYPSGHSTFATTTVILLAEMVPEKRAELYARGWEYGRNRVVGGVHFLSDVEAGRIEATLLIGEMEQNPAFRADLAEARMELRHALGLAQR